MTTRKTGTREEWLASRRELFRPCGIRLPKHMTGDSEVERNPQENENGAPGANGENDDRTSDPASQPLADGWRTGAAKALERQFAAFVPKSAA